MLGTPRPRLLRGAEVAFALLGLAILAGSLVPLPGSNGVLPPPRTVAAAGGPGPHPAVSVPLRGHPAGLVGAFPGLNASSTPCGCLPADPALAVGPNDTLELTEGAVAVFSSGFSLLSVRSLPAFFGAPAGDGLRHPAAAYDGTVHRFVAAAVDPVAGVVRLAASTGPNASGPWRNWSLAPNGSVVLTGLGLAASGPTLGVSAQATNGTTGLPVGSELWVLDAAALDAASVPANQSFGPTGLPPGAVPVPDPSASGVTYFVAATGGAALLEEAVGVPPAASIGARLLSLPAAAAPVPISQPAGPNLLLPPNASSVSVGASAGRLELARTVSNGANDSVQLAAWDLASGALEESLYLGNGTSVFAPGLALDAAGDTVVVANAASATLNLSVWVYAQPANELNATPTPAALAAGVGDAGLLCSPSHLCAWGNLSAAVADPLDPSELWVVGAFDDGSGPAWTTSVGLATAPPLVASFLGADRSAADVGQWINFTADATGGIAPYTYAWTTSPGLGCPAGATFRLTCRASAAGQLVAAVAITDAAGRTVNASANFTVSSLPYFAFLRANRTSSDVGQNVSFSASGAGGVPPYGVTWQIPSAARCTTPGVASVNCSFAANGSFRIGAVLTDRNGASVPNATEFTVYPVPQITGLAAEPSPPTAGISMNLSFGIVGGSGSYRITWSGLPAGCASVNATRLTCTPSAGGTSHIGVSVLDSNGAAANATLAVAVGPAPARSAPPLLTSTQVVEIALALAAAIALFAVLYPRRPRPPLVVEAEPVARPPELAEPTPAPSTLPPPSEGPTDGEATPGSVDGRDNL